MAEIVDHPLASFGYTRPPHWLWRLSPRTYVKIAAVKDIWLIVRGKISLHSAWQAGYEQGHLMEVERQLRGGR